MFVKMQDNFMSGWGGADGKVSIFAVECHGAEQVRRTLEAAHRSPEMDRIFVVHNEPKDTKYQTVSIKTFNSISGGSWIKP